MKRVVVIGSVVAFIALSAGMTGCMSQQTADQTDVEYIAYEAGAAIGDLYIVNKGLGGDTAISDICETVFAFIQANPEGNTDLLDSFVLMQINKNIPADEQARRDLLYLFYRRARTRIHQQLELDAGMSVTDVLVQFRQGLIDSTGMQIADVPGSEITATEVTALLEQMEATGN